MHVNVNFVKYQLNYTRSQTYVCKFHKYFVKYQFNYLLAAKASSSCLCLNGSCLFVGDFFCKCWGWSLNTDGTASSLNFLILAELFLKSLGLKCSEHKQDEFVGCQSCRRTALAHNFRRDSSLGYAWKVRPFLRESLDSRLWQPTEEQCFGILNSCWLKKCT